MMPFGRSPTRVVSLKLILTLLAAVDVAAPRCGFVASNRTLREAIACSCVAFSSTFPTIINLVMCFLFLTINFGFSLDTLPSAKRPCNSEKWKMDREKKTRKKNRKCQPE